MRIRPLRGINIKNDGKSLHFRRFWAFGNCTERLEIQPRFSFFDPATQTRLPPPKIAFCDPHNPNILAVRAAVGPGLAPDTWKFQFPTFLAG